MLRAGRVEIFDTTLRDGCQLEGISLTVDDKLRIAEQLDHLGVHYIEGGGPAPTRRTTSSSGAPPTELELDTSTLVAFGSTRRVKGKVDEDATLRNLVEGRHVDGVHRRQGVGLPRHRSTADDARRGRGDGGRLGRVPAGPRAQRHARRRALLRRLQAQPRVRPAGARGGGREGRELPRAVRHQRRLVARRGRAASWARSSTTSATTSPSASTCTTTPAAAWPTRWPACAAAPRRCRAPSTARRAHRQLQPHHDHPQPHAEDGHAHAARRTAGAAHAGGPPHRRAGQHQPRNPQAPYVGASAFAHKAGLHVSAIVRRPDAYEHVDPELVGNGTRFVVSEMAGKSTIKMKAKEIGLELDGKAARRGHRRAEGARARGLPLRGGRRIARAAHATGRRLGADRSSVESFRVLVERPTRPATFTTEATIKCGSAASASSRPPRATARSTPSTPRCARRSGDRYPALAHVHLTDYKVRILDTAKGTGAVTRVLLDSTDGDALVVDHRREREHHRGDLAGTGRLDCLRLAQVGHA